MFDAAFIFSPAASRDEMFKKNRIQKIYRHRDWHLHADTFATAAKSLIVCPRQKCVIYLVHDN